MKYPRRHLLSQLCMFLLLTGCVSVGKEFSAPTPEMIKNGATTRAELLQRFGFPT